MGAFLLNCLQVKLALILPVLELNDRSCLLIFLLLKLRRLIVKLCLLFIRLVLVLSGFDYA